MKKLSFYLIIILILNSCNKEFNNKCFEKQGAIIIESRRLSNFKNLIIDGVFDVILKQDTSCHVSIEASENLIQYINTSVYNDSLVLSEDIKCKWSREYVRSKITVYITSVKYLQIKETCSLSSTDTIKQDYMEIWINADIAETDIMVDIDQLIFIGSLTSSGKFILKGKSDYFFTINANSAMQVDARKLKAINGSIYQNSIGNIKANVENYLKVEITNSGNIYMKQSPNHVEIIKQYGGGKIYSYIP